MRDLQGGFARLAKEIVAFLLLLLFIYIVIYDDRHILYNEDLSFLYNRAFQIYACILDGNVPFFYYNDFGGVGYGTSFFYGAFDLYPFVPLVPLGEELFCRVFIFTTIILYYYGSRFLIRRFSDNDLLISFLFIFSDYSI